MNEFFAMGGYAAYVWPALAVTANVSNLTDEKYYNNLGFYNGGYYGDARQYSLKLNYNF